MARIDENWTVAQRRHYLVYFARTLLEEFPEGVSHDGVHRDPLHNAVDILRQEWRDVDLVWSVVREAKQLGPHPKLGEGRPAEGPQQEALALAEEEDPFEQ